MGASSEVSTAIGVLSRNRSLFVAAFLAAIVNTVAGAVQFVVPAMIVPIASFVVSVLLLFVTPFFEGGLLGMAQEGLGEKTSLGTFAAEGKANYLRLLGGRLLLFAIILATSIGLAIIAFAVIFGIGAIGIASGSGVGSTFFALFVLVMVVGLLVMFVPLFFLQFYAPAVVVADRGVVASFKESYRLVRSNLASVLGFDVIVVGVSLVGSLPTIALFALHWPDVYAMPGFSPYAGVGLSVAVGYLALTALLSTPVVAFVRAYQVAYFVDQTAADSA